MAGCCGGKPKESERVWDILWTSFRIFAQDYRTILPVEKIEKDLNRLKGRMDELVKVMKEEQDGK